MNGIFVISWIVAAIICISIGNKKGRPGLGWVMGLLLGWIGVIVMACASTHSSRS